MKKFIWILLFLSFPAYAFLSPIDPTIWSDAVSASQNVIVSCDCVVGFNADGSQNVTVRRFRSIHKSGNQISCVVTSPAPFFIAIANQSVSLWTALLAGGGATWINNDGKTWYRVIFSPFKIYQDTPDPWCTTQ